MSFEEDLESLRMAMRKVNFKVMGYFDQPQLLAFQAGVLLASSTPCLTEKKILVSSSHVVTYERHAFGKSNIRKASTSCHGSEKVQLFDFTTAETRKQLCETSIVLVWVDDPVKEVLEAAVKAIFNTAWIRKGNCTETTQVLRNIFITCNCFQLDQTTQPR